MTENCNERLGKKKIDLVIREVPDFPKRGINFKDITTLLLDQELSSEIIDTFINRLKGKKVDAIVGVESRGFLFGFLLANKMGIPFIPIRKSGKLPGETLRCKYDLEYGSETIEIHKNSIQQNDEVLIVDDLIATGGSASASASLIELCKGIVSGFLFVIAQKRWFKFSFFKESFAI